MDETFIDAIVLYVVDVLLDRCINLQRVSE